MLVSYVPAPTANRTLLPSTSTAMRRDWRLKSTDLSIGTRLNPHTTLRRQAWLESEGNRVLRIQVSEITRSLGDVLDTIDGVLLEQEQLGFSRRPNQPRPRGPSGAPHPRPSGGTSQ